MPATKTAPGPRLALPLFQSLLFLVLVTVVVVEFPQTGATRCFRRCNYCRDGVINCTGRSLLAPPRDYPESINTVVLTNNRIRFLGPNAFRRNTRVETLKIKGNNIVALRNRSFFNLPNLANLNLNSNRLYRIHVGAFRNMQTLRSLFLGRNRIRSIAGLFQGVPQLYHLNLNKNRLSSIGKDDLSNLPGLYYLDLRYNRITNIDPEAFAGLSNLRHLFINNNNISRPLNMTFGSTVLQLVDFSNCNLTTVPQTFPASVSDLRLGNNRIRMVNYTDFKSITDLRMLGLERNILHFFAEGALSHMTELNEVWLPNNRLVNVPRDLPANVRRLHLGHNNIHVLEADLFGSNSRLEYLSLENNYIQRIHPNAFRSMRFLQVINFQNNNIQRLESRTFNSLGGLHMINLNNNSISTIEHLAFRNMANLTNLHLNYIMPESLTLRGNFMGQMLRLQGLYMMSSPGLTLALMNQIENMHPNDIVPMTSMADLDLSYNNLRFISSRIPTLFPNIQKIPLDGNAFRCSRSLWWLVQWMSNGGSTVFYNYENVVCATPQSLSGTPLTSVQRSQMAVDATRRSSRTDIQETRGTASHSSSQMRMPERSENGVNVSRAIEHENSAVVYQNSAQPERTANAPSRTNVQERGGNSAAVSQRQSETQRAVSTARQTRAQERQGNNVAISVSRKQPKRKTNASQAERKERRRSRRPGQKRRIRDKEERKRRKERRRRLIKERLERRRRRGRKPTGERRLDASRQQTAQGSGQQS